MTAASDEREEASDEREVGATRALCREAADANLAMPGFDGLLGLTAIRVKRALVLVPELLCSPV